MEALVNELDLLGFDVQLKHDPTESGSGMVRLKTQAGATLLEHPNAQQSSDFQRGSGYKTWLRALPAPTSPTFSS